MCIASAVCCCLHWEMIIGTILITGFFSIQSSVGYKDKTAFNSYLYTDLRSVLGRILRPCPVDSKTRYVPDVVFPWSPVALSGARKFWWKNFCHPAAPHSFDYGVVHKIIWLLSTIYLILYYIIINKNNNIWCII